MTTSQRQRHQSLSLANSRSVPSNIGRLAGLSTPPVQSSGSNRLPLIGRRVSGLAAKMEVDGDEEESWGNGGRGEGFPIPKYLTRGLWNGTDSRMPRLSTGRRAKGVGEGEVEPTEKYGMKRIGQEREKVVMIPTEWNTGDKCALAEVSSDGLGVAFAGSAKYGDRDAAAVRTTCPIPATPSLPCYYYELQIIDRGESGYISIGLSHSTVSLARLPGWELNSWGYHGDDGRRFGGVGTGERYGETWGTGDTVGCGVDFMGEGDTKKGARCFFTKNGQFMGYAFNNLHGTLYPSVGLRTPGENVRANFGRDPFKFDIDSFVRERQLALMTKIESLPTPPSLFSPSISETEERKNVLKLIESYLLHHGYNGTSRALVRQLREEEKEKESGFTTAEKDVDMEAGESEEGEGEGEGRSRIRTAFSNGDIQTVFALLREHYPTVLLTKKEDGGKDGEPDILLKLRLREFIESAIRVREEEEVLHSLRSSSLKGKGKGRLLPSSPSTIDDTDSTSLDELLLLGQQLSQDYKNDSREKVQEELKWAFSLLAYARPEEMTGRVGWLLSDEARWEVADEVNREILVSQSLPPIPHLEGMYRHASACIFKAAEEGSGEASLVDLRECVLGE